MIPVYRRIILILIMLWLPLQSTTAAVISLCAKEKERELIKQTTLVFSGGNATTTLPCAQEKHSSDKSGNSIATAADQHHAHKPLILNSPDEMTSNLQCNDVLCQINYTTLVLTTGVPITFSSSAFIPSFTSGFISFVPEQLRRPPIS